LNLKVNPISVKLFLLKTINKGTITLEHQASIIEHREFASLNLITWPVFSEEWPAFGHESIGHEPLTALEQWKVSRHWLLWLMVSNWAVSKQDAPFSK